MRRADSSVRKRINQGPVNSLPIVLAGDCSADQQLVVSKVLLKQATCPHFSYCPVEAYCINRLHDKKVVVIDGSSGSAIRRFSLRLQTDRALQRKLALS